ncbi:MAG: hypothetical protein LUE12_02690 [Ruminococcus sp.]|nr:hypothetical protein [Ruminococcus sp.]
MAKRAKLSKKQKQLLALIASAIVIILIFITALFYDDFVSLYNQRKQEALAQAAWEDDEGEGEVPEADEEENTEEAVKETYEDELGLTYTLEPISYLSCSIPIIETDGWKYSIDGDASYNQCSLQGDFSGIQIAVYPIISSESDSVYAITNDMSEYLKLAQFYYSGDLKYKSISCLLAQDLEVENDEDRAEYTASTTFSCLNSEYNNLRITCYQRIITVRKDSSVFVVAVTGDTDKYEKIDAIARTVSDKISPLTSSDSEDYVYQKMTTHVEISGGTVTLPKDASINDVANAKMGRLSQDTSREEYGVCYVAGLCQKSDDKSELSGSIKTAVAYMHSYYTGGSEYSFFAENYYLVSNLYYYQYSNTELNSGGHYINGEMSYNSSGVEYLFNTNRGVTHLTGYILPFDDEYDAFIFVEYTTADETIAKEYLDLIGVG